MTTLSNSETLERWISDASAAVAGTVVTGVDLSGCARPRAARSRLQQAMARVAAMLYTDGGSRAVVVVWTGVEPASSRVQALTAAAAESLHRRSEMTRGRPLGLSVVFADARTPAEALAARLASRAELMTDGVAVVGWGDTCAHGVREAAAACRI